MGVFVTFPSITTKEKATDRANIRVGEIATKLIGEIEKQLVTKWVPGDRITIWLRDLLGSVDYPNKKAVINTILAMYESAGWEATYNSSQRDGDWIEIK